MGTPRMKFSTRYLKGAVAAIGLLIASGCGDTSPTAPNAPAAVPSGAQPLLGLPFPPWLPPPPSENATLIQCPSTSPTQSTTSIIGPLGGTLAIGATQVLVPAGALLTDETITLTIPASQYMEIDVSVEGLDTFLFEKSITVTVDYSRCSSINLFSPPISVWHIDSDTKALLENMGGLDLRLLKRSIFSTGHLSGYALAF